MFAPLRVGNASAFWGDSMDAAARLVRQAPDLDVLTLDYLAEVSMSILAKQRQRDPAAGYARDFIEVIASLAPTWRNGRRLRVITNAGGLSPQNCANACAKTLREAGCSGLKIGVVSGDDVSPILREAAEPRDGHPGTSPRNEPSLENEPSFQHGPSFAHLETGRPISDVADRLVTANAYVGAAPVVEALGRGAQIVITGRLADPSLTVAPCAAHFGWDLSQYDRLAGATVAGHLIECGTQVTGGISTDWLDIPDPANIGYPIVEVSEDGSCVVTKPQGTGGRVSEQSVKEQLLYELGDPARYLSPDATVSFLTLEVSDEGNDRVRVRGATGGPPPAQYKVSATYRAGFRAAGTLAVFGRDAKAKALRCGQIVRDRLAAAGAAPEHYLVECLGAGDVVPTAPSAPPGEAREVVLRIAARDQRRAVIERFTRELAPLISSGPQGTTGYAEGRPPIREVFGYWPTLIDRDRVRSSVEIIEI